VGDAGRFGGGYGALQPGAEGPPCFGRPYEALNRRSTPARLHAAISHKTLIFNIKSLSTTFLLCISHLLVSIIKLLTEIIVHLIIPALLI
jgi:hypothetical protein